MAVDDLWYKRGRNGERIKSQRHGRGRRWRVRYVDDRGRTREQLYERKADAERFDASVRADVSRGQYIDPAAGRLTVSEYGRQWRADQLHRDSTAERVNRAFRLHVDPTPLGNLQLGQARSSQVQSWVKDRAEVLAPSTMAVLYGYVSAMFSTATIDRLIGVSPCQGITLPEIPKRAHVIPIPDQVHAIAAGLKPCYQAQVYVGAGLGLRQAEAWGLELEHIDFLRRQVNVCQQLILTDRGRTYLGPPKTATSTRTLELGQVTSQALAEHVRLFPPVETEIEDRTNPRKPIVRKARLIFLSHTGRLLRRGSWSREWLPAVAAAGMPKGFGFHGLRHYFATLLIHNGASVKTVQLALGHSSPTITLNTYVGEWPEALDRTRTIVDRALGGHTLARAAS